MKCTRCGKDARKKDRGAGAGRCPSCGQRFVADPAEDRLTDVAVQKAVERVTAKGTFHFLKSQLVHELRRRHLRGERRTRRGCLGCALALLLVSTALTAIIVSKDGSVGPLPLGIAGGVGALVVALRMKPTPPMRAPAELADAWLEVNPSKLVIDHEARARAARASDPEAAAAAADLGAVSFDRVLVCDRPETVDFFLANRFHFHYSCPVLGGHGYPEAVFPDMVARLRRNPRLEVFVLHDLTPKGLAFARQVRTSPEWFGGHPHRRFIDVGLLPAQVALVERMLLPLHAIPGGAGHESVPGITPGMGAEVAMLRPETLVRLVARSLEQRVPFHEQRGATTTSSDGGGSDGGYG